MPYLKSAERKREIDNCLIGSHGSDGPNTPGELNYAMTILALRYLERVPSKWHRRSSTGAWRHLMRTKRCMITAMCFETSSGL